MSFLPIKVYNTISNNTMQIYDTLNFMWIDLNHNTEQEGVIHTHHSSFLKQCVYERVKWLSVPTYIQTLHSLSICLFSLSLSLSLYFFLTLFPSLSLRSFSLYKSEYLFSL